MSPDGPVATVDRELFPDALREREWWVCWILDGEGRKRPVAPWQRGDAYPVKWRNTLEDGERPETDFETAMRWTGFSTADVPCPDDVQSERLELGLILPTDRPDAGERITLIDWDDVRDPDTGEIHPIAAAYLNIGNTYAEISQSDGGAHQFVVGELSDRGKLIAEIDDEPWVGDNLPQVEVYDGGRHVAMTGRHVTGTPDDVATNQDVVDDIVAEFADDPDREPGEGAAFGGFELEPTEERPPCYHAALQARADPPDHLANWELIGYATMLGAAHGLDNASIIEDLRAHPAPPYGFDPNREPNEVRRLAPQVRSGDRHPPSAHTLADIGILPDATACDCPLHDSTGDGHQRVVECEPPLDDLETADVDAIRERIRTSIYDAAIDHDDAPTVLAHDPGAGKTTTAHLAADDRDRSLAFLFDKHRKAHEHRADDVTPDVELHLRGAAQPRDDTCAQAVYADDQCSQHGHTADCPRMCPIYDRPSDDDLRQLFEAIASEVGPVDAHVILDPHDGDDCAWLAALQAAPDVDSLVGVHQYQHLDTVCSPGEEERDVLVDESPGALADDRRLDVEDLTRLANTLADWTARTASGETLRRFGQFTRQIVDAVIDERPLADLDPPEPVFDAYETYDDAAGHYAEYVAPDADWQHTEALVQAKRAFLDHHLAKIHDDEWDGTPLAIDALLAAAAEAGLKGEPVRRAAAHPTRLVTCPVCEAELQHADGRRLCDRCGWDEAEDLYTAGDVTEARILAWVDGDPNPGESAGLVRRRIPTPDDLPDDPVVLDATATPEKIAALYGADQDDVAVYGDAQHALGNVHITQCLDGQYHYSTITKAVEEDRSTARRIQQQLDRAGELHDRPLIVGQREVRTLFDLPDNAEFIHFHGARGLNFEECDAVVVIGAPHPHIPDLKRTARLLAQGRDDLRVGGEEHSTRRDCRNDPVYRKLRYEDEHGTGRAVATKHYTGLVGALFREAREHELEQVLHRIRPLLADELKHAYLITNVPTDLPIDEVCTLEELAEPAAAMLPVADGALDLAEALVDVGAGEGADGFRAGALVERQGESIRFKIREVHRLARASGLDVCERTVRRWVKDLEELSLVDAGEYESRSGVSFTADTPTLTQALSILTSNAGVEVAMKRRLASLAQELDSASAWLRAARDELGLTGDRRAVNPGDPPPDDTV